MPLIDYAGRRVVVTGCSSGIGAATAQLLQELRAEVHGLDVVPTDLDLTSFTAVELLDPQGIRSAAAGLGGPVDALFNCAGIPPGRPPVDVVAVNYLGTRLLTEALLPSLSVGSAVVSVGSNGGMAWDRRVPVLDELIACDTYESGRQWCEARPDVVAEGYRFSKEAMVVWTLAASAHYISRGVRINLTAPGAVQTPMLDEIALLAPAAAIDATTRPIGRRSTPAEQAAVLVMLNSPALSYVNGAIVPVDGGFAATKLIPTSILDL